MPKILKEKVGDMLEQLHYYPKNTAFITSHWKGRDNVMPSTWNTPVSVNPPLYGVTISPSGFTYQLIVKSKEFGVNFLTFQQVKLAAATGGCSGSEVDKFQRFAIDTEKAVKTAVPILKDAYVSYECKVVDEKDFGDHRFFIGEIVAVHFETEVFTAREQLDMNMINPILYIGRDVYLTTAGHTTKKLDRQVYSEGVEFGMDEQSV
jgi:flavin reductase (DIM6/NTAB) family NADH-FMN oxidoreductase RutF